MLRKIVHTVRYSRVWEEYRIECAIDGAQQPVGYCTADRDDATATAKAEQATLRETHPDAEYTIRYSGASPLMEKDW